MTQSNLKIAITGGIGGGKTTVSEFIKEQGYPVISCDQIYKELSDNRNFLNKICNEFGNVTTAEGLLDRKKLSDIVFSDETKLKKLNEITHPAIMEEAFNRMSGEGIYFCEVPLLFEGGFEKLFDKVLVILRDKSLRISSVAQRDKTDTNSVKNRINSQFDYENLSFEKYYVIHNDSDLANLRIQTEKILKQIIK